MYLFSARAIYDGLYPRTSPIIISGPHRSLGQRAPCGAAMSLPQKGCRKIVGNPVLGGLHHIYRLAE
jgi:hypothetical protein